MAKIREEVEGMRNLAIKDINTVREPLQKGIDDYIKQIGDKPTPEQTAELNRRRLELVQKVQPLDQDWGQKINNRQAELINDFRTRIAPVAKGVAVKRGMTIVLTASPNILSLDDSADITDATLAEVNELIKSGAFQAP